MVTRSCGAETDKAECLSANLGDTVCKTVCTTALCNRATASETPPPGTKGTLIPTITGNLWSTTKSAGCTLHGSILYLLLLLARVDLV